MHFFYLFRRQMVPRGHIYVLSDTVFLLKYLTNFDEKITKLEVITMARLTLCFIMFYHIMFLCKKIAHFSITHEKVNNR